MRNASKPAPAGDAAKGKSMVRDQRAELKRIAEAATPGPWLRGYVHGRCTKPSHGRSQHPGPSGDDPCDYTYKATLDADGDLIAPDTLTTILARGTMEHSLTPDTAAFLLAANPAAVLALIARIEALEAGLRPFGDAAEAGDDGTPDTAPAWESGMAMAVTHGDFRRAANLLGDRHDG